MKYLIPSPTSFVAGSSNNKIGSETLTLINPSTLEEIAKVQVSDEDTLCLSIDSAERAQRVWMKKSPADRVQVLEKFSSLVDRDSKYLAWIDSISVGRPIRHTIPEYRNLSRYVRYWSGMLNSGAIHRGDNLSVIPSHLTYTTREPLGIIASIQPWNGPAPSFIEAVSPILACGNAAIIKPSEISPLSALHMAKLFMEAGAPAGLVNVLTGDGSIGEKIIEMESIKGIVFTGSVSTGKKVGALSGAHLKKVVLELGGKSPNIVFPDSDLREAAKSSLWGIFYNSGQVCCAGTRVLVSRSIVREFLRMLAHLAKQIKVGDALDARNHMGPVASHKQFMRVTSYLDFAKSSGISSLYSDGEISKTLPSIGYYVPPTILCDVDIDSPLAQEEIFGPIVSVITFDTDEEAITLANNTKYGLAAKIWTKDLNRMLYLANEIKAGSIWGNSAWISHPALPFGGFKSSGIGSVNGIGSIEAFTQIKTIGIRHSKDPTTLPYWQDIS